VAISGTTAVVGALGYAKNAGRLHVRPLQVKLETRLD